VTFNERDLEITTGCVAAHPDQRGGQHVAKECSGVRILHRPTGIGVLVNDERSQFKNKQKALEKLRTVLGTVETARAPKNTKAWCSECGWVPHDCEGT